MIVLILLLIGAFYYVMRRKARIYRPGARTHIMELVSSSMLLSEVDPTRAAQVHIVSLIKFEERLEFDDFRDRFIENVILTDNDSRFLYRLECSSMASPAKWIKAENWRPSDNFSRVTGQQTEQSVKQLVSDRLTAPLDISKPVWEVQFIDSLAEKDSKEVRSAMILTMHHSMGDGFTLCHQLMRRACPADNGLTMHECYPFQARADKARGFSLMRVFSMLMKTFRAIVKLLLLKPDPVSAIRNSSTRRMDDRVLCELTVLESSVDRLKSIAHKATKALGREIEGKMYLNDVVVAACSIALSNLMQKRHDVTSAIWIGLNRKSVVERPKLRKFDWGNENLGTCYLQLPTGESDPITVLTECHKRMAEIKVSPEPLVANRLLALLGSIPLWILWPFRNILMDKMSTSISNFPGPTKQIRLPVAPDGNPNRTDKGVGTVKDTFFLVAPPFSYGPYVTIVSYCGKMYLAISVCEKLMSQETVTRLVEQGVENAIRSIESAVDAFHIDK